MIDRVKLIPLILLPLSAAAWEYVITPTTAPKIGVTWAHWALHGC